MSAGAVTIPEDALVFVPLGGSDEIGMNMNLFHAAGSWLVVDCGVNFAGEGLPGIDLLMPDPGFITARREKIAALVLTHGHEDHIGAVAHLWPQLGCPIYATPFTAELVRGKLEEAGLQDAPLHVVEVGGSFAAGPFTVRYVPLAHSIPEGHGLLIETPLGRIFHTGDWKLDHAPQIGRPSTPEALKAIGDAGVRAMIGDSTNVFQPRASGSEQAVRESLMDLLHLYEDGRVVITTFASNLARLKTIAAVARHHGRRLVIAGRALERVIAAGRATGYLDDWPETVPIEDAGHLPRRELLILCTGAQGEPRAALSRMARGEHAHLALEAGDVVIFSAKIIPGNELAVARVANQLARRDVEVVTEREAFVHVSGHPGREELREMYAWIRPEVAVPVHGEPRHLRAHARLATELGVPEQVIPFNGAVIQLAPGPARILGEVPARRLALDGHFLIPLDDPDFQLRRRIGAEGLAVVSVVLGSRTGPVVTPDIRFYGVLGIGADEQLELEALVTDLLARESGDLGRLAERIRIAVRRRLRTLTGKNPIVDVRITRAG